MLKIITFSIFKFEINLFSLVSFATGVVAGIILLVLYYLFACLKEINKNSIKLNENIKKVSQEEIKEMIEEYQESFEAEKSRRKAIPFDYFKQSIWDMMNEIASQFYPKSKKPLTELTINEMIELDKYIVSKIEALLGHKGIQLIKGLRLSTIMAAVNSTNKVRKTKPVKFIERHGLIKAYNTIATVVTSLNPVTWVKRLVINPAVNVLIDKICLVCYSIIGGETYNVYSKQAFKIDDQNIADIISSIDKNQENEKELLIIPDDNSSN